MAGPVASVLLRESLRPAQREMLMSLLRAISSCMEERDGDIECSITDTDLIGGGSRVGCLFLVQIAPPELDLEVEGYDDAIAPLFGFHPVEEITVTAMCNKPEDHRDLGLLVAYFAEIFDGIVGLGGTIEPRKFYRWGVEWVDIADEVNAWLEAMPGIIHAIRYRSDDDGNDFNVYHICDAEFMRGWLAHPDFRMVK